MLCRYETKVVATCPVDQSLDVYDATFESDRMIAVEDILSAVRAWADREDYQENIAVSLAQELGCKVTLIGLHSNVKTTAIAP